MMSWNVTVESSRPFFLLSGKCLTTLQKEVILNGNLPAFLRMFVSYFLQQDVGKCKVKTPLVTMLFRQLIVDKALFVKLN